MLPARRTPCSQHLSLRLIWAPLLLLAQVAAASEPRPDGLWQTFEVKSGLPRAEVRLETKDGVLSGHIVRVLSNRDAAYPICSWCAGARKDAPFVGMTLLEGLRPSAHDPLTWEGGQVLDPDTGKLFRARLRLDLSGGSLELRGYVGTPLVGTSQVWRRIQ